ncbi:MFS transporter [Anaerobacillus isosaccharinicus]|uniref:MFS transporter n=2 Tax=Anaerobacillus isosaccharinicus TaxID=1532552 RepID=A0A7S7RAN3_9BACI|nr:MFS transporter [Anaerobacillus isosaccharinicus]QOY35045.1 MFS transporter [Anaerobacillus isosaccharinicus]
MNNKKFKMFVLIWIGQLVSVIGTSLTSFALGFWVLTETGSVTQFSMIILSLVLPTVIVSPFAGVIIDRFSRKKLMILSNCVAAFSTMIILVLVLTNSLEIWHIYLTAALASTFNTFLMPAYQSIISLLVSKEQLGRANGMIQIGESASIIIAPTVAGFLLHLYGLQAVIIIDLIAFTFAITTLFFAKIPEIISKNTTKLNPKQFLAEAKEGWNYLMARPAFKWLLIFGAAINLLLGFLNVLMQPLIIALSSEQTLGIVLSITGFGMLLGGIIISIWGGPKNRINGMFLSCGLAGVMIALTGLTTSIVFITACFFLFLFLIPIVNSCSQALWQSKVEPTIQGRVFTIRRMLGVSLYPLAIIMAGPLVDKVLNPIMEPGGLLANSVGQIIGVGEGRGIGLLFIIIGILFVIVTATIYLQPKVRNIDKDIPDAIVEEKLLTETV